MAKPQINENYLEPQISLIPQALQTGLIYSNYGIICQGVFKAFKFVNSNGLKTLTKRIPICNI